MNICINHSITRERPSSLSRLYTDSRGRALRCFAVSELGNTAAICLEPYPATAIAAASAQYPPCEGPEGPPAPADAVGSSAQVSQSQHWSARRRSRHAGETGPSEGGPRRPSVPETANGGPPPSDASGRFTPWKGDKQNGDQQKVQLRSVPPGGPQDVFMGSDGSQKAVPLCRKPTTPAKRPRGRPPKKKMVRHVKAEPRTTGPEGPQGCPLQSQTGTSLSKEVSPAFCTVSPSENTLAVGPSVAQGAAQTEERHSGPRVGAPCAAEIASTAGSARPGDTRQQQEQQDPQNQHPGDAGYIVLVDTRYLLPLWELSLAETAVPAAPGQHLQPICCCCCCCNLCHIGRCLRCSGSLPEPEGLLAAAAATAAAAAPPPPRPSPFRCCSVSFACEDSCLVLMDTKGSVELLALRPTVTPVGPPQEDWRPLGGPLEVQRGCAEPPKYGATDSTQRRIRTPTAAPVQAVGGAYPRRLAHIEFAPCKTAGGPSLVAFRLLRIGIVHTEKQHQALLASQWVDDHWAGPTCGGRHPGGPLGDRGPHRWGEGPSADGCNRETEESYPSNNESSSSSKQKNSSGTSIEESTRETEDLVQATHQGPPFLHSVAGQDDWFRDPLDPRTLPLFRGPYHYAEALVQLSGAPPLKLLLDLSGCGVLRCVSVLSLELSLCCLSFSSIPAHVTPRNAQQQQPQQQQQQERTAAATGDSSESLTPIKRHNSGEMGAPQGPSLCLEEQEQHQEQPGEGGLQGPPQGSLPSGRMATFAGARRQSGFIKRRETRQRETPESFGGPPSSLDRGSVKLKESVYAHAVFKFSVCSSLRLTVGVYRSDWKKSKMDRISAVLEVPRKTLGQLQRDFPVAPFRQQLQTEGRPPVVPIPPVDAVRASMAASPPLTTKTETETDCGRWLVGVALPCGMIVVLDFHHRILARYDLSQCYY